MRELLSILIVRIFILISCRTIKEPVKLDKRSNAKIKQKRLKEDGKPKEMMRKKSLANTSGASILYAGRMSSKDRRLLKMILVIFLSFLTCYLPITLSKVLRSIAEIKSVFITSYLLVYLTTCINPIIYVVMSSEVDLLGLLTFGCEIIIKLISFSIVKHTRIFLCVGTGEPV